MPAEVLIRKYRYTVCRFCCSNIEIAQNPRVNRGRFGTGRFLYINDNFCWRYWKTSAFRNVNEGKAKIKIRKELEQQLDYIDVRITRQIINYVEVQEK